MYLHLLVSKFMEINSGFWSKLKKPASTRGGEPTRVGPFFCLAPMADVTDTVFRRIIAKYSKFGGQDIFDGQGKFTRQSAERVGGPDVMWTEFVSADGLCHPEARQKLLIDLAYTEAERPIVAQLFTANPENMKETAKLCASLGFNGVDINMGCPDKSIEKQEAGAAMIKNPEAAKAIIRPANESGLPVSIKTRIGYNPPVGEAGKNQMKEWLSVLLSENLAALTVHLRTRKEMSKVPAHWELMPEIVVLRDKISPNTLIIGNGDVLDINHARELAEQTGCDGIMLGKAIFGRPWLFSNYPVVEQSSTRGTARLPAGRQELENREDPNVIRKILGIMVEHTKLFEELLGEVKSFSIMKKHFKAYVSGWDGAKELRMKLMETEDANQVEEIVHNFLLTLPM